jgi:hypothetical protein
MSRRKKPTKGHGYLPMKAPSRPKRVAKQRLVILFVIDDLIKGIEWDGMGDDLASSGLKQNG